MNNLPLSAPYARIALIILLVGLLGAIRSQSVILWRYMLLLTGPPASGKTQQILDELRNAARPGSSDVCLLVPTATMAEHLRHTLAREGLLVRPSRVLTLFQFVERHAKGFPLASRTLVRRLVQRALATDPPEEFGAVRDTGGLERALARLIEEFSESGAEPHDLERLFAGGAWRARHAGAVIEIYARVATSLLERGLNTRAGRLRSAALAIREEGLSDARHVLLDGFFTLNKAELDLIRSIVEHADVTVTLPEWEGAGRARDALLAMGFEERKLQPVRSVPEYVIFHAPNRDAEAGEVARRIVGETRQGRPFRDIGVVLRTEAPCADALRAAFERFGIPAHFYFGFRLADHPAVKRLVRLIDALLSGWDLEQTLSALRLRPATVAGDDVDFMGLEQIPAQGLDTFPASEDSPSARALLDRLKSTSPWRLTSATPPEWATRLKSLAGLFPAPEVTDAVSHEQAERWQAYAAALGAYGDALEEAACVFDASAAIPLAAFWEEARQTLEETTLHPRGQRRNVVHVMDAYEARQWELPVVFVCGLVEDEFPRRHTENPLVPDRARIDLSKAGYPLRTASEREREEQFLFDLAVRRPTERLILSCPSRDLAGDDLPESFFLQEFRRQLGRSAAEDETAVTVRPPSLRTRSAIARPLVHDEELQAQLVERHRSLSPTSIETYLACPFQFFAGHTLRLQGRPAAPGDRLDARVQGSIVHAVLAETATSDAPIEAIFDRLFEQACREAAVPAGYRTERIRLELLRSLETWRSDDALPPAREIFNERDFMLPLEAGDVEIRGRVDRIHVLADDRALVVDFKYSGKDRLRDYVRESEEGDRVQAGLYLLASKKHFGIEPAGMLYCTLRKETQWGGWQTGVEGLPSGIASVAPAVLTELAGAAKQRTLDVSLRIRNGQIEPAPAAPDTCKYCDYATICRIEVSEPRLVAGGTEQ